MKVCTDCKAFMTDMESYWKCLACGKTIRKIEKSPKPSKPKKK